MKVSVILPSYNREKYIAGCLDSLLKQDFADYEILAVDDCSTDQTRNILSQYEGSKIRVFYNDKNSGPSFSRNLAVLHALGEILAFTDSDCMVDPKWLREIVRPFFRDQDIVIVGGKVEDPTPENYWQFVNFQGDFIARKEGFVRKVVGCNMAARKDFIKENTFDEAIYPAEELDLCLRALKKKKRIYYAPRAKVLHYRRDSFRSTIKQQFNYGFYNTVINLKNGKCPFVSLGSLLLAIGLLFYIFQHWEIAFIFFASYLAIVFYVLIFQKVAKLRAVIIKFPGFLVLCLINSMGSLVGFLKGIKIF